MTTKRASGKARLMKPSRSMSHGFLRRTRRRFCSRAIRRQAARKRSTVSGASRRPGRTKPYSSGKSGVIGVGSISRDGRTSQTRASASTAASSERPSRPALMATMSPAEK
jgi:hypothetical protein